MVHRINCIAGRYTGICCPANKQGYEQPTVLRIVDENECANALLIRIVTAQVLVKGRGDGKGRDSLLMFTEKPTGNIIEFFMALIVLESNASY